MANSLLTMMRDLQRRRGRERRGLALAEGVRLTEEALAAGLRVRGAAVSSALEATPRGRALKAALRASGAPIEVLGARALDELADTEQPQGIIAVIEPRPWRLEDIALGARAVVLVLDGVQDPGNVGAVARSALALGAAGMVALQGTAELTNPKTLRGSMGALFRFPAVSAGDDEFLAWARHSDLALWVADGSGEPANRLRLDGRTALVLGNEGAGVRAELRRAATGRIAIPLRPGVESLNVAVAAGILLYEVAHER
ncbi:MAG: TrmH family RNA methyltransferase [Gemmatimonadales bacterium]